MMRFKISPCLNFLDQVLCLQNKDRENFERYISKVKHNKLKATIAEITDNNIFEAPINYFLIHLNKCQFCIEWNNR